MIKENIFIFCIQFYRLSKRVASLKNLILTRQQGTKKPVATGFRNKRVKTKVEVSRSNNCSIDSHPDKKLVGAIDSIAREQLADSHLIGLHASCALFSRGNCHQLVQNFLTGNLALENHSATELSNPYSVNISNF